MVTREKNGAQGKKGQRFRKEMTPIEEKRLIKLTIDKRVAKNLEIEADLRGVSMGELANTLLDDALDDYEVVKKPKVEKPKTPKHGDDDQAGTGLAIARQTG
jgi:hypothetical protein